MAVRTKSQVRGMLYNIRSIVEGMIKMLESDVMSPQQAEDGIVLAVAKETAKDDPGSNS